MIGFRLDKEAQSDLEVLAVTEPLIVTRLKAFIEQAKRDPGLLNSLSTHSFNNSEIDVKKWIKQNNAGRTIWRLRFCCFVGHDPEYRVFYCVDNNAQPNAIVYILGIKKRGEIDYDDVHHPSSCSIIDAFSRYESRIHM